MQRENHDEMLGGKRAEIIHGAALRQARNWRFLSQRELADKSAVSTTTIRTFEAKGECSVTRLTVEALAEALRVSTTFLLKPPSGAPPASAIHMRSRRRVQKAYLEHLRSRAGVFSRVVHAVGDHFDFPLEDFPVLHADTRSAIELAAAECRRRWGIHHDAPIAGMVRELESAGAVVGRFDDDDASVDAMSWVDGRPFIFYRRVRGAVCRMRFSLAHECGHIIIHRGKQTGDPETEQQADWFASAFLLPSTAFWREFPRPSPRLDWSALIAMKKRWGVSVQALVRRAFDLGIIGPSNYRWANIRISQLGWRTCEPGEPSLDEVPEMLPRTLTELALDGTWSSVQLVDLFDSDVASLGGVELPSTAVAANVVKLDQFKHP
ncbi:MAG TPA: XRE family transcriptional regulator [Polyangiaceae bacterium]|nr:XRE family transcriptional regulator [Polyangiaceae bacterium]